MDAGYGIATDGLGNSIISGKFTGSSTFGSGTTPLFSAGGFDVFVAKYDVRGELLWARQAGGPGDDQAYGIATDGVGNSILTGRFMGTAGFGGDYITSEGGSVDIFLAKYDASGEVVWVKQAGGTDEDQGFSVATDGIGNILVTGRFRGQADFDSTQKYSAGNSADIFIAKYDLNGNLVWVKQAGGMGHDEGLGIAADAQGNSFVTGRFEGEALFETTTLISTEASDDIFIAKYDVHGNLVWAKKAGGSEEDCGYGIAADAYGNTSVTGKFQGEATFGATAISSAGGADIFIARYDANGDLMWVERAGGTGDDSGSAVAAHFHGNTSVTGKFQGPATFGAKALSGVGGTDIFIARYNVDGDLLWVDRFGGAKDDAGLDIAIDVSGNEHVVGTFQDTAGFDSSLSLSSAGEEDIFALGFTVPVGDINGDGRIGLEEAIHALQVLSKMK